MGLDSFVPDVQISHCCIRGDSGFVDRTALFFYGARALANYILPSFPYLVLGSTVNTGRLKLFLLNFHNTTSAV